MLPTKLLFLHERTISALTTKLEIYCIIQKIKFRDCLCVPLFRCEYGVERKKGEMKPNRILCVEKAATFTQPCELNLSIQFFVFIWFGCKRAHIAASSVGRRRWWYTQQFRDGRTCTHDRRFETREILHVACYALCLWVLANAIILCA